MKHETKIVSYAINPMRLAISLFAVFFFCCPLALEAKDFCGEEECYDCCNNNCDSISLKQEDMGKKEIKKAIQSCKSGCNIILWTASAMNGRISKNAPKSLREMCADPKRIAYPDYCMSAGSLWGSNCHKRTKENAANRTDRKNKSGERDIDKQFNQLEKSTKENILRDLIGKAFPDLSSEAIKATMRNSTIMRGIDYRNLTTPLRMAEEYRKVIARIKEVKRIIPVDKLDTLEAVTSELEPRITEAITRNNTSRSQTEPSIPSTKSRQSTDPVLEKYQGLPPDKVNAMLQKELESIMALLSKPGASPAELRTAMDKLLGLYDALEKDTKDPKLIQQIRQMKTLLQQIRQGM